MKNIPIALLLFLTTLSYRSYGEDSIKTVSILDQIDQAEYVVSEVDSISKWYRKISRRYSLTEKEHLLLKLISESERLDHNKQLGSLYNSLGVLYCNSSKYAEALDAQRLAMQNSQGDEKQIIMNYNDLGVIYRRLDKPQLALKQHFEALKLIDSFSGDQADVDYERGVAYNSIGNVNLTLNQPEEALKFFERSLELEINRDNTLGIAINLNNIGYVYQISEDYDKAIEYYRKSLSANREIKSNKGLCICYNSIGDILFIQEKYEEAKVQFDSAHIYSNKLYDLYHSTQSYGNLGKVLLKLDNLDEALVHIKKFYNQAEQTNSGSLKSMSNQLYSDYYKKVGKFDSVLIYYEKAIVYSDSILNSKNSDFLNNIQTIYLTKEKEQEIKLLIANDEIKAQRVTLFFFLAIILVMMMIGGVIYMSKRRKTNEFESEQLKQQILRSQMNPHFLFNALGSIQNYMYNNETHKAAGYLNNFAQLTKSILEQSTAEYISLKDEIEMLGNYILLEQMRMDGQFDFSINGTDHIDIDQIYVPPMFIQPFVENAIKHGLSMLSYKGELNINITQKKKGVMIEVVDNGIGIDKVKKSECSSHKSMATTIFNQRKKLLAKRFKREISMNIKDRSTLDSSKNGTVITILLPIINHS